MTAISDLSAIDVHGHYGPYEAAGVPALNRRFMSGDPATVVARARQANTAYTVVSPIRGLMPRGEADVAAANEDARSEVEAESSEDAPAPDGGGRPAAEGANEPPTSESEVQTQPENAS